MNDKQQIVDIVTPQIPENVQLIGESTSFCHPSTVQSQGEGTLSSSFTHSSKPDGGSDSDGK